MTYTFNFNDRESYLAFRKGWKLRYVEQSIKIRGLKSQLSKTTDVYERSTLQSKLHYASRDAYLMMVELEEAKAFKNEQLLKLADAA